ncbi:hypothetical protein [Microbacterium sp. 1P06AB]|uniref:hypothetical protein n=1 Tax=Microbacterium sp. 1P06AB TaxID=3132289 RepID=UPI0039A5F42A
MPTSVRTPGPRVSGAALVLVGIGGGFGAGWLIARAPWSILAAGLLTLSTVAMAIGVLWTMRPNWDDKTWPPSGRDLPPDIRLRRNFRILGIILLTPTPIIVALLVWLIVEGSATWNEMLLLALPAATYAAMGVWVLRRSRWDAGYAASSATGDGRPEQHGPQREEDEWRVVGGPLKGTFPSTATVPLVVMAVLASFQLLRIADEFPWGGVVWAAVVATGLVCWLLFVRRQQRPLEVLPAREEIRFRGRILRWSEVTRAELSADPPWKGAPRTLILSIGGGSPHRGRVVLRRKGDLELSDDETTLLARIIDASAIDLPHDKDDPRGRFSRQLYPNNLTKAEAAAVVADPPGADVGLPISAPV